MVPVHSQLQEMVSEMHRSDEHLVRLRCRDLLETLGHLLHRHEEDPLEYHEKEGPLDQRHEKEGPLDQCREKEGLLDQCREGLRLSPDPALAFLQLQ